MTDEERGRLKDYLAAHYHYSALEDPDYLATALTLHCHGQRVLSGRVRPVDPYTLRLTTADGTDQEIPKLEVSFYHVAESLAAVEKRVKRDSRVAALGLSPIVAKGKRHHVKNKTLYPFLCQRQVLFCTTLEGDVLRGLVTGIHRYELRIALKGGVEVYLMRHALYDLRDKKGVSWLKSAVQARRRRGAL